MLKNLFDILHIIKSRIRRYVFKRKFNVIKHNLRIITLGSRYGGWTFVDAPNLQDSTIISCGLGEDASFDIEFANLYNANIILVDPTPRAVHHYNEIIQNLGSTRTLNYRNNGAESVRSYDLKGLRKNQLQLVEKAIWKNDFPIKFYLPKDKSHVSHSIVNFQNDYSSNTESILVEAITMRQLMGAFDLSTPPILKLDIEGAEADVIQNLLSHGIFPNQILIEYDEMQNLNNKIRQKIYDCHLSLLKANYKLVNIDNINFTYIYDEK
jgi:FkbM family methyltransferase